jgi:type I restriction enzyme S subunit
MKALTVKHKWLSESDLRLDASFHLSDGPLTKLKLKNSPYSVTSLNKVTTDIFKGNIFKRTYVDNPETGYHFMTASDMMKSNIESGKYVSKKYTETANLLLKKGWILVSRSGTLGNTVYTNEDFEGVLGTDDLIRIIPSNKVILSGYMYAYLTSKYGYGLLTQSGYGGVVQHIEPHHIEDLPIPILPQPKQLEIHNLIIEASKLRVEANRLLKEADEKFHTLNELSYPEEWLTMSENAIQLGNSVKKSDLFTTTIKARNHSLRANKIINYWSEKVGIKLEEYLGIPFRMGARASFKRINSSNFNGHDLISQGDIHKQNPKIFKQVRAKRITDDDKAQRSSIIMPSAGTLGENEIFTRPLLIRNNFEEKLLSEVIGKFKCSSEIDAAYLFTALSSKAGFRILRAMVYGTNLLYPNWELIKDVTIPVKSNEIKDQIGQIVLKAFDKRGLADQKENQAIDLVEKEIESWQK